MSDFEAFWKAYPKKVAKGDARKAWLQTEKYRPSLTDLLKSVEDHCKTEQWQKENHQFVPYPATFLRQERWEDELDTKIQGVVNGQPWHETWTGIKQKGVELGIKESDFEHAYQFKQAVMRASVKAA